jgi:hypothetical protein
MYVIYKKLPKVKNHTIAKMALGYFVDGGFFPGHFLSGDFAHLGLNLNLCTIKEQLKAIPQIIIFLLLWWTKLLFYSIGGRSLRGRNILTSRKFA